MLETVWDLEIRMVVPFDTLVIYPDDNQDEYIEDPNFKRMREYLKINIDISSIIEELYINREKNGSISIYYSDDTSKNYILLDTHIDPTDQLDLITIGVCCSKEYGGIIRRYVHEFYAKCKYNISYSEGLKEITQLYQTDFSLLTQITQKDYQYAIKNRKLHFYQSGNLLKTIST